jgi:uncharacterized PurR-regulated membrane protein YhhQ (DUF165 family)
MGQPYVSGRMCGWAIHLWRNNIHHYITLYTIKMVLANVLAQTPLNISFRRVLTVGNEMTGYIYGSD